MKEWCWSWRSSALATSCEELNHWKRLWCWEGLGAGGKGDDSGWDGGWHHWLDGRESEWTAGAGDGQGGLACCDSWGHKESDTTERLNWTDTKKKDLNDPDKHDGLITHLEPDILECKVKWALGSITTDKTSGGDGIPVELFQILKDDGVKMLPSICQQIWKTQQWPQDWKRSVFIPIPKKDNAKECSNYHTIAFIAHASKAMLKILQARLQ